MAYTNDNMREDVTDIVGFAKLQSLAENNEGSMKDVFTDRQRDELIPELKRIRSKMVARLIEHLKLVPD